MATWTNQDGLLHRFGVEQGTEVADGVTSGSTEQVLEVFIDSQDVPVVGDANDDRPHLPADAFITKAYFVADTAWTGTGTLDIGVCELDGTVIDANGIDAAIDVDVALAAAGDVVTADGALADGTATIGSDRAWVYAGVTGTISAGTGRLFIRYFKT